MERDDSGKIPGLYQRRKLILQEAGTHCFLQWAPASSFLRLYGFVMTSLGNDKRCTGDRIGNDLTVQSVDFFDQTGCDDLKRSTLSLQPSLIHGKNIVCIPGRKVDIMKHHKDRGVSFFIQIREKIQDFHLISNIQIGGGFIQQENIGLLCESQSDPPAAALPEEPSFSDRRKAHPHSGLPVL